MQSHHLASYANVVALADHFNYTTLEAFAIRGGQGDC